MTRSVTLTERRAIVTKKRGKELAAKGLVEGTHFIVEDHCMASWGTRTCYRCYRFIKRRDQRCI